MLLKNGITFSEKGSGSLPIICLHGIGGDNLSFEHQLDDLSKSARIISWNMPGYNGSLPLEEMSFKNLSERLLKFLDDLKVDKAILLGQSIGGMIAQEFYFHFPERVQGLILIATTSAFGGKNEDFKKSFLEARLKPLNSGRNMYELAKSFIPEILNDSASKEVISHAINSMSKIPLNIYKQVIECLITFDRYNDSAKILVPCCLIAGSEDLNAPSNTMKKIALKIKDSEFHIINNIGHLVNLEAPEQTNKIILEFLKSNY